MKALFKNIVTSSLTSPPFSWLSSILFENTTPVFMLHRMQSNNPLIKGISQQHLHHCLQYLCDQKYNFTTLTDIIHSIQQNQPLPTKSIAFTLDDGYLDQAEVAAPIFLEYGCPITIFLITGLLDGELWPWDDKVNYLINVSEKEYINIDIFGEKLYLKIASPQEKSRSRGIIRNLFKSVLADRIDSALDILEIATEIKLPNLPPDDYKPITWDFARKLEKVGVDFAPHTVSHRILSKLDAQSAKSEITHSWRRLQDELVKPSPIFCYPTGGCFDYGPREIDIIKQEGLIGAVSTMPCSVNLKNTSHNYRFNLPRYSFPDNYNDFIQYSSWIETAKNKFRRSY